MELSRWQQNALEYRMRIWQQTIDRCKAQSCKSCDNIKLKMQRERDMYGYYDEAKTLESTPEKYVVLTNGGSFKGSWAKEKDALKFCKNQLKGNTNTRFLILQAIKEVGQKTPEIEIEDIK